MSVPTRDPLFLSVAEVALRFGVNAATVRRWVRDGHLAAVQVGTGGALHVPEAELERLVAEAKSAATS
jgi:excisionase family DNA binding protein